MSCCRAVLWMISEKMIKDAPNIRARYIAQSLTHWGRVTHICVIEISIIGSDNGLSPGRRQAIIWNNAGILLIGSLGTNFSEILIRIQTFIYENALENVVCEMASILSRPQWVKQRFGVFFVVLDATSWYTVSWYMYIDSLWYWVNHIS